jgi:hypothetical protein
MWVSQKLLIAWFCFSSKIRTFYDLAGDALLPQKMYSTQGAFYGAFRQLRRPAGANHGPTAKKPALRR